MFWLSKAMFSEWLCLVKSKVHLVQNPVSDRTIEGAWGQAIVTDHQNTLPASDH